MTPIARIHPPPGRGLSLRTGSNLTPSVFVCRLLMWFLRSSWWSFGRGELLDAAEPAEAALAAMEIRNGGAQIVAAEIGPQHIDEAQLGVGRLPQQEIGQPLLTAGADQE